MKLSHRLAALQSIILTAQETLPYNHIWDCCCDHGYLGMSLLNTLSPARDHKSDASSCQVHFVDIASHLIEQLNKALSHDELRRSAIDTAKTNLKPSITWRTHCLNTRDIPLHHYRGRHLIIIAGVGGVQTQALIQQLCDNHPHQAFDVLLCPVHQLYPLRTSLNARHFQLIEERLIKENKRYYEILHASNTVKHSISANGICPTGKAMWKPESLTDKAIANGYLNKLIQHYQKMLQGKCSTSNEYTDIENTLRDYQRLL